MADIDNQKVDNGILGAFDVETTQVSSKQVQHATLTTVLTFRQDDQSATVSYFGFAAAGTSEASALWRIFKLDTTTSTNQTLKFADGNAKFDNIWANRLSLTYT